MVVSDVSEFLHCAVQFFFRPEPMQVGAFILQGVEVSLHRRIVVWVSGFAHTGFGYAILSGDAFVGSSFLLMESDDLLFKFGSVVL